MDEDSLVDDLRMDTNQDGEVPITVINIPIPRPYSPVEDRTIDLTESRPDFSQVGHLCNVCIAFSMMFSHLQENNELVDYIRKQGRFAHQQSVTALRASAETGCGLCSLIWRALKMGEHGWAWFQEFHHPLPEGQVLIFRDWLSGLDDRTRMDISIDEYRSDYQGSLQFMPIPDDIALTLDSCADRPNSDTGSGAAFQWVHKWLGNCIQNHPECKQFNISPSHLPTRVLDVGDFDGSQDPYLYISDPDHDGQLEPYLTLSHRWGNSVMTTTTTGNITSRRAGIPLGDMPKTFRDAVLITRRIGVRYLWIDSLCIIQDSPADWEAEAVKMGSIYRNSIVTIAALGSTDSMSGCFTERKNFFGQPCKLGLKVPEGVFGSRSGGVYVRLKQGIGDNAMFAERAEERGPLDSRGWVLQERVLSTRILNYTSQELRWECISQECSESIPEGLEESTTPEVDSDDHSGFDATNLIRAIAMKRRNTDFIHTIKRVIGGLTNLSDNDELETFHFSWLLLVELYSRRQLTMETDKLVAIAGMAIEIKKMTGDDFLAGLWKRYLWKELLWCVKTEDTIVMGRILHFTPPGPPSRRLTSLNLPTWSWASVSGWIRYADNEFEKLSDHDVRVEIIDVKLEHPEKQFSGHAVAGSLTLRGTLRRVMSLSTATAKDIDNKEDRSNKIKSLKTDEEVGYFVRDETERLFEEIVCMVMTRASEDIWCLAIEPTERKENEYRRIGLVWWRERQWDEDDSGGIATVTIV